MKTQKIERNDEPVEESSRQEEKKNWSAGERLEQSKESDYATMRPDYLIKREEEILMVVSQISYLVMQTSYLVTVNPNTPLRRQGKLFEVQMKVENSDRVGT